MGEFVKMLDFTSLHQSVSNVIMEIYFHCLNVLCRFSQISELKYFLHLFITKQTIVVQVVVSRQDYNQY